MKKVPKSSIDPKASIPLAPKLRAVSTHSHHFRIKKTFFREILRRYNGAGIPGSSTARKTANPYLIYKIIYPQAGYGHLAGKSLAMYQYGKKTSTHSGGTSFSSQPS